MPSEPDVRSRGQQTSSLHKTAVDETNVAALTEPTVSKKHKFHLKHQSPSPVKCCRIGTMWKKSHTISATELCRGNQCRFGTYGAQKTDVFP